MTSFMPFASQKALYQALLQDDERAFEHLYQLLYQRIANYIFESGGSHTQTKTVVHETIISFLFNLRYQRYEWREEAELMTYVVQIARNKWSQMQKDARRRLATQVDAPPDGLPEADEPGADDLNTDELDFEEKRLTVERCLAQLGEKCRQSIELYYFQKKTMGDVANALGWANEHVAKKEKYRCLQKLRQKLNIR